jgi:hypothetical protein
MLGHASAAMTLDIYSGLFEDQLDDLADRLGADVPYMRPEQAGDDAVGEATSP